MDSETRFIFSRAHLVPWEVTVAALGDKAEPLLIEGMRQRALSVMQVASKWDSFSWWCDTPTRAQSLAQALGAFRKVTDGRTWPHLLSKQLRMLTLSSVFQLSLESDKQEQERLQSRVWQHFHDIEGKLQPHATGWLLHVLDAHDVFQSQSQPSMVELPFCHIPLSLDIWQGLQWDYYRQWRSTKPEHERNALVRSWRKQYAGKTFDKFTNVLDAGTVKGLLIATTKHGTDDFFYAVWRHTAQMPSLGAWFLRDYPAMQAKAHKADALHGAMRALDFSPLHDAEAAREEWKNYASRQVTPENLGDISFGD